MVAYTNAAANEFCWELYKILGPNAIRNLCLRTGNLSGVDDPLLPVPFSIQSDVIKSKKIIICTTLSLKRLSYFIKFDNIIIDEAGIEKLEHLLSPFYYGINQLSSSIHYNEQRANQINSLMDLINQCGIVVYSCRRSKTVKTYWYLFQRSKCYRMGNQRSAIRYPANNS